MLAWSRRAVLFVLGLSILVLPTHGQDKKGLDVVHKLVGHTDPVYAIGFSGDGKFVATGSFDNTLKLWDPATGASIRTFTGPNGHQKMVVCLAFSPDGQYIGSGSADQTLKLWDVPVSSPIKSLTNPANVQSVAFYPETNKAASGGKDGSIRIWNLLDGKELAKCEGHTGPVMGLAFAQKGEVIVSVGVDRTLRAWNAATGLPAASVVAHSAAINGLVFGPNNGVATYAEDGTARIWGFPLTPAKTFPPHGAAVTAMVISPDNANLLSAGADKVVRQTQVAGKEVRVLTGPDAAITSLGVAGAVVAGSENGKAYLWNLADGKPIGQPQTVHTGAVTGVGFGTVANQYFTAGQDGMIKSWIYPSLPTRVLTQPEAVTLVLPVGKRILSGGADKIVRTFDLDKLALERQFTGHTGPITALTTIAAPPGALIVSGSEDATIRLWEASNSKEAGLLAGHTGAITGLTVTPGNNYLLSTGADGSLRAWQTPVTPGKSLAHPDAVTALATTDSRILTASGDKIARVWKISDLSKERDLAGPTLAITSVAQSADNKLAAVGSLDKHVYLYNLADGKQLQKIAFPSAVQSVALNAAGKLAVGLADGPIKLINAADGKEIKSLDKHQGPVTALTFNPAGDLLISAGANKNIELWTVDGAPKTAWTHAAPIVGLAISKDGKTLAWASDKQVKAISFPDGKELANFAAPADVKQIALSPDGSRILLAGADKTTRLVGLDGKSLESFSHEGPVQVAAFLDAKKLLAGGADKSLRQWNSSVIWAKHQTAPIRQMLLSPKNDFLAIVGDDKTLRLVNPLDGKEIKSLIAHDASIVGLGISADATRIATLDANKVAKVWTLASLKDEPKLLTTITLKAQPGAMAFSPNGQRLAFSSSDGAPALRVFDVALGKEVQTIADPMGVVRSLAFLPDGRNLLSGSVDKNLRLHDVNIQLAIEAHPGGVTSMQPNGTAAKLLSAGADKTAKIWDLTVNPPKVQVVGPFPDSVKAVVYSRDFAHFAAAIGKSVKMFGAGADIKETQTFAHPAEVLSVSFSSDKNRIVTGSTDKQARMFDIATGKEITAFVQPEAVGAVFFTTNPAAAFVAGGKEIRLETTTIQRTIVADPTAVYAAAFNPANNTFLTAGSDKQVKQWNTATGQIDKTYAAGPAITRAAAFSKSGQFLATGGDDQVIRIFNVPDQKEFGSTKVQGAVRALAFSPNNLTLAVSTADKKLNVLSTAFTAGQPAPADFLSVVQSYQSSDLCPEIAFGTDNGFFLTAGPEKNLTQWKLASTNPTRSFAHPNMVGNVAFSPLGNLVLSACHDGKVRLYDITKNALVKEFTPHVLPNETMIYALSFTNDGKQFLTSSYDRTIKLYDVGSGNLVREFKAYKVKDFEKGHQDPVFAAALSPDGKFLASASGGLERVIKIWNAGDGTVIRDLANPNIKTGPMITQSHPGTIFKLHYTKDGKLLSLSDAPQNQGYLAVWNPADGKLLHSETVTLGTLFGAAISPDERLLGLGVGARTKSTIEPNVGYLVKSPMGK